MGRQELVARLKQRGCDMMSIITVLYHQLNVEAKVCIQADLRWLAMMIWCQSTKYMADCEGLGPITMGLK